MNITFEDFKSVEIKIGKVLKVEKVETADKLLKLTVDFGSEKRQIVAGIAQWYQPGDLEGKKFPFVLNIEPRVLKGVESQGMLLAADNEGKCVLLTPDKDLPEGSIVK